MAILYERVATSGLRKFHRQVASEVTSSLSSGRVLDVGTSPGHLLIELMQHNPNLELVGFDLSRKMLKIAKQLIERDGKKCVGATETSPALTTVSTDTSIRLVRGDVRNLPFPDGAFDLVVSTLSLHHWHDPARGVRECLRVTAPGGRCWIYDFRTDVPARIHAELVTGEGLGRLLLSWIYKFHGVDPKQYEARTVSCWLDGGATVEAEVHAAYLKLNIKKPLSDPQDNTACCKCTSSISAVQIQHEDRTVSKL